MKPETFIKEILKAAFPRGRHTAQDVSLDEWLKLHEAFNALTGRIVDRGEITKAKVDKIYSEYMDY